MALISDEKEKILQQEIKRISGRFNNVNKFSREVKEWSLGVKKAIDVACQNRMTGKMDEARLRWLLDKKVEEAEAKLKGVANDELIFKQEIDRLRHYLIELQKISPPPIVTKFNTAWATRLAETETQVSNRTLMCLAMIKMLNELIQVMKQSPTGNALQMGKALVGLFGQIYDMVDKLEYLSQRIMKDILAFYAQQFKLYKSTKI